MKNNLNIQRYNSAYNIFGGKRHAFTTLDFGQLAPMMADEVLEKDSWRIRLNNQLEIAPLAVKSMNNIYYNQGAYFVPYSQLDETFSDRRSAKIKHFGSNVSNSTFIVSYANIFDYIFKISGIQYTYTSSGSLVFFQKYESGVSGDNCLIDFSDWTSSGSLTQKTYTQVPIPASLTSVTARQKFTKKWIYENHFQDDIHIVFSSSSFGSNVYYIGLRYNKKGQYLRKIFDGLGYKMPLIYVTSITATTSASIQDSLPITLGTAPSQRFTLYTDSVLFGQYNAYPLVAFLKVVEDYFAMSSTRDEDFMSQYLDGLYHNNSSYFVAGKQLKASLLIDQLLSVSLQLRSDSVTRCTRNFYSANNPFFNQPEMGFGSTLNFHVETPTVDSTQPGSLYGSSATRGATTYASAADIVTRDSAGTTYASNYVGNKMLDILHRHLLTTKFLGGKLSQRLRAFFGISDPIDDALHCFELGVNTIPIQINGQMIQSNTYNGVSVDEDAGTKIGQAFGNGTSTFTFQNTAGYGIGITLNWLSIETVYANRTPKFILRSTIDAMYRGNFDGQGFSQSVSQMEVNTDSCDPSANYVFGQEPLYEDYRNLSVDFLSGDIHRINGMRAYLTPRDWRNILNSSELYAEFSAVRSVRQSTDEFGDMWIAKDFVDPVIIDSVVELQANRNIQDSEHAMALPTGDQNILLQANNA